MLPGNWYRNLRRIQAIYLYSLILESIHFLLPLDLPNISNRFIFGLMDYSDILDLFKF